MPELNQLSMASAKTGLGTLLSNPQETAQVIKANFPGVQVRQDQKGNFILRSSVDGQEYAIKPGFQVSDIPRAIAGALAFTPAGRAETLLGAGVKSAGHAGGHRGHAGGHGRHLRPGRRGGAGVLGAAVPARGPRARPGCAAGEGAGAACWAAEPNAVRMPRCSRWRRPAPARRPMCTPR
jgi:hypothetical protein